MSTRNRFLIVLVVASLALWGCAQGPANGVNSAERIRALENKLAKTESDYHTASGSRDQLRKKLTTLEDERVQLAKERDSLKSQLAVRTVERDHLQTQYDAFRKGIKNLLGQAELSAASPSAPASTNGERIDQRKS
jgi:chromosome segregation ATPase